MHCWDVFDACLDSLRQRTAREQGQTSRGIRHEPAEQLCSVMVLALRGILVLAVIGSSFWVWGVFMAGFLACPQTGLALINPWGRLLGVLGGCVFKLCGLALLAVCLPVLVPQCSLGPQTLNCCLDQQMGPSMLQYAYGMLQDACAWALPVLCVSRKACTHTCCRLASVR
jgi:hypothetical protein